ncbi:hypothetical protein JL720_2997 [Aureococcus anophagefferens]|nr:hypothetical protein JL720_2997 [Aureococcus anophagefferens]
MRARRRNDSLESGGESDDGEQKRDELTWFRVFVACAATFAAYRLGASMGGAARRGAAAPAVLPSWRGDHAPAAPGDRRQRPPKPKRAARPQSGERQRAAGDASAPPDDDDDVASADAGARAAPRGAASAFDVLPARRADTVSAAGVDFAFMANDHTAILAPNLACFLKRLDPAAALYAGHALAQRNGKQPPEVFNSGAALRNPGLVLARCLASRGVTPVDTRVAGRHVFHAFGPVRTSTGGVDDWYRRMHEMLEFSDPPAHPLPSGAACCDGHTVSFHYVEAAEQVALHAVLREDFRDASNGDRDEWLRQHWPSGTRNLGGYEHAIPENDPPKRADFRDLVTATLALATPASCPAEPLVLT